jgi:hypothetical protein
MKKLIIVALLAAFAHLLPAQVFVAGKNINDMPDVEVIELSSWSKPFQKTMTYSINYGQEIKSPNDYLNFPISDSAGEKMVFSTPIAAINFLEKNGWRYEFPLTFNNGGVDVVNYHFRRKR